MSVSELDRGPAPEGVPLASALNGELSAPTNVVAALARVMSEIGGIQKLTPRQRGVTDSKGISYAYRGIDQICAEAQGLFGKYGVVTAPDVEGIERREVTVGGNPWDHVYATVVWHVFGPGGVEDRLPPVTVIGEGRDNSDKAVNKAMTTSYKNLLLRLLCIGDPKDDTDDDANRGHETEAAPAAPPPLSDEWRQNFANKCAEADVEVVDVLREAFGEDNVPEVLTREHVTVLRDAFAKLAPPSTPSEGSDGAGSPPAPAGEAPPSTPPATAAEPTAPPVDDPPKRLSDKQKKIGACKGQWTRLRVERQQQLEEMAEMFGKPITTHGDLTVAELGHLYDILSKRPNPPAPPDPEPEEASE